ncbi:hypothetical protein ACSBR1_039558 [Camellia fascicularis]
MIDLSQNHLHGLVPRSLQNCTLLEILVLGNNQMEDTFPSWLGALPMLQVLILRSNIFHGAINVSQAKLNFVKLSIIDLSDNGFSGNLPSEYFENWNAMTMVKREKLTFMQASQEVPIATGNSRISWKAQWTSDVKPFQQQFRWSYPIILGKFDRANLLSREIPQQLSQLTFLEFLNIAHNHLTGPIPRGNQFETFENRPYDRNFGLWGYPLSKLCGNLEASPPPSLSFHGDDSKFPSGVVDWIIILLGYGSGLIVRIVIGHTLTTRYHEWFVEKFGTRKQTQRKGVQSERQRFSWHYSSGFVPQTFMEFIKNYRPQLVYNNLSGTIPKCLTSSIDSPMVLILSCNDFHGLIPQKFSTWINLTMINLSQNKLYGQVPRSLAICIMLEILVLGNNEIEDTFSFWLQIFLSYKFHGTIQNLKTNLQFPNLRIIDLSHNGFSTKAYRSIYQTTNSKGKFQKLLEVFVGLLKVLNVSNNNLIGKIPSSLPNLTELESLDLSINLLSGEIPPQLPYTSREAIDTFENYSYLGNSRLCGKPLSKSCGNLEASTPPPLSFRGDDSKFPSGVNWIVIFMGYGSELIVGLVTGHILTTRYHKWFDGTFGRGKQAQRREKRKGRRN